MQLGNYFETPKPAKNLSKDCWYGHWEERTEETRSTRASPFAWSTFQSWNIKNTGSWNLQSRWMPEGGCSRGRVLQRPHRGTSLLWSAAGPWARNAESTSPQRAESGQVGLHSAQNSVGLGNWVPVGQEWRVSWAAKDIEGDGVKW